MPTKRQLIGHLVITLPLGCVLEVTDDGGTDDAFNDDIVDDSSEGGYDDGDDSDEDAESTTTTDEGCEPPNSETWLHLNVSAVKQFEFSWGDVPLAEYYKLYEGNTQILQHVEGTSSSLDVPLHLRRGTNYTLYPCNDCGCEHSADVVVDWNIAEGVGYLKSSDDINFTPGQLSLSDDGNTLVVRARFQGFFVFTRSNDAWVQQAHVQVMEVLGFHSLAVSGDGNTIAAGYVIGEGWLGTVHVFTRMGGHWSQTGYVTAAPYKNQWFGGDVALSYDGATLAVGARQDNSGSLGINGNKYDEGGYDTGAVYVFELNGNDWSQQAYIKASQVSGQFGTSVALSADGNTLAVGAPLEDVVPESPNSGAVYLFTRSGDQWAEKLRWDALEFHAPHEIEEFRFGSAVALSSDGIALGVGAPNAYDGAGAAYVFRKLFRDDDVYQPDEIDVDTDPGDAFGSAIAVSQDGRYVVVGAAGEDGSGVGVGPNETNLSEDAGAVYVFETDGRILADWGLKEYVKAPNTDPGDNFGEAVDLSVGGELLVVGAPGEDSIAAGLGGNQSDNSGDNEGAVYIY